VGYGVQPYGGKKILNTGSGVGSRRDYTFSREGGKSNPGGSRTKNKEKPGRALEFEGGGRTF